MITEGEEKYIRLLYRLGAYRDRLISTTEVARRLSISPPTAVEALRKLRDKGLVVYVERRGVCLSEAGLRLALKIVRHHRILELVFSRISGMSIEEVCQGVRGVELRFAEEFIEEVYRRLGRPRRCPHGEDIPSIEEVEER